MSTSRHATLKALTCSFKHLPNNCEVLMNTFILRWNPNISSYKMETHLDVVAHTKKAEFPQNFDWSVYEWQKVKDGDMVILLQVRTDSDGIAMIGKIMGKPEADKSWRDDGSKAHYVYIEIFDAYNPSEFKELLAENFENEFDKIKWHKGHSGELILVLHMVMQFL